MNQDDIEAVVEVARNHGVKVTAHVHSDQSGRDAILAGVDSLEHASLLCDDTIALAVANNVALSMDVYNGTYTDSVGRELGYPDVFLKRNLDTTEAQRIVFEKAVAAGATLLRNRCRCTTSRHGWMAVRNHGRAGHDTYASH